MVLIELDHVVKRYGAHVAVPDLSLSIRSGERLAILGPQASGKSTILRAIAGAERIDSGAIRIDGRDATHVPPKRRGCVPVSHGEAFYPNLTVGHNIDRRYKQAGLSRGERAAVLARIAPLLRIDDLLERLPTILSPSEQLRVAIACAMAPQPHALLFDEPWTHVEPGLRRDLLQFELVSLHRLLDVTLLFATRDPGTAAAIGERIVVLNHGEIEQVDVPRRLVEFPATPFVAGYVGRPPMNLLIVGLDHDGLRLRGRPDVYLPGSLAQTIANRRDGFGDEDFILGIRPEMVRLVAAPGLEARVLRTEEIDGRHVIHLDLNGQHMAAVTTRVARHDPGSRVCVQLPPEACHVFLPQPQDASGRVGLARLHDLPGVIPGAIARSRGAWRSVVLGAAAED